MVYSSERGDIRIVAVGDAMPTRSLTKFDEPEYLGLVELLRSADASVANLETTVRTTDEGYPNVSTGTIMSTPPELLSDLQWMGINLVSASNNHASDYGVGGILATIDHLGKARLPFAGIGSTLMKARAPGYLDTRMGRVALVSATSFFAAHARAGDSRPDTPGRPGINPLRFSKVHTVDEQSFREIARMKEELGYAKAQKRNASHFYSKTEAPLDLDEELVFLDGKFRLGSEFSVSTVVHRGRCRRQSPADPRGAPTRRLGDLRISQPRTRRCRARDGEEQGGHGRARQLRARVLARGDRRGRRHGRLPRPARAVRRRNLQGQADPPLAGELHSPERYGGGLSRRRLCALRHAGRRHAGRLHRRTVRQWNQGIRRLACATG